MNTSISLPADRSSVPASGAAAGARTRLAYIDTIRVILIVLVVMVHASVTYGSVGGWFYVEPGSDDLTKGLLTIFVTVCQAFFMGLFFFISGYFTPGSFDRKGAGIFLKDRLLRLGLPFLVFSFILAKYPLYIYYSRNAGYNGSLLAFGADNFLRYLDAGPTWFLFALLVLAGGYGGYRLLRGKATPLGQGLSAPGIRGMLAFAGLMAVTMFLTAQISPIGDFKPLFGFIYLQPAFFPQYVMMYAAGILAYRNDWLSRWDGAQLRAWAWVAAGCLAALPILLVAGGGAAGQFDAYISGFAWQAITLNLWVGLTCTSFSLTLLLWLRGRGGQPGLFGQAVAGSAFAAYLIHPVVLVAITSNLSGVALHPLAKFAMASLLAVSGSFLVGWLLRQVPGVKEVV